MDDRDDVTDEDHEQPEDGTPAHAETTERTGHAGVDEVLAELDRLEELEVHDHVALFETAHQGLRQALDDGGR